MPDVNAADSYQTPIPSLVSMGGAPLYVTGEDALAVTVLNAAAGVTVTVTGRILQFGATRPTPFAQTLIPATDRSASVQRFTLGDGWLLNAEAIVSAGAPAVGQTFVRLSLVRGVTANAPDLFTLAADYVTAKLPLSYPGSGVTKSIDGAGALRSIAGATPGAGAEISETVPTGARWELLAFKALLTTSGTPANRSANFFIDDGANILVVMTSNLTEVASSALIWSAYPGALSTAVPAGASITMPGPINSRLGGGYRIRSSTVNLQAADQWSAVQYLVREWIEGA